MGVKLSSEQAIQDTDDRRFPTLVGKGRGKAEWDRVTFIHSFIQPGVLSDRLVPGLVLDAGRTGHGICGVPCNRKNRGPLSKMC